MSFNNDTDMYRCLSESSFKCFLKHVVSQIFLEQWLSCNSVRNPDLKDDFRSFQIRTRISQMKSFSKTFESKQTKRFLRKTRFPKKKCVHFNTSLVAWKETPSKSLKLILNFKFKKYALFKGEYKIKYKMFRFHAKRNPSISPKVFLFKSTGIKNIMVCYFWGGEDVIKMWSKMFEFKQTKRFLWQTRFPKGSVYMSVHHLWSEKKLPLYP